MEKESKPWLYEPLQRKKLTPEQEKYYEDLAREKAYRDNLTIMEDAVNKGKAQERTAIAARMKEIGMTDSQINAVLH